MMNSWCRCINIGLKSFFLIVRYEDILFRKRLILVNRQKKYPNFRSWLAHFISVFFLVIFYLLPSILLMILERVSMTGKETSQHEYSAKSKEGTSRCYSILIFLYHYIHLFAE